MAKAVGLSRNIKLQWLNRAVELLEDASSEDDYKAKMNEYLSFEIESATNLRKTREILMHLWYYEESGEIKKVRTEALDIIRKYPDYALEMHWCLLLMVYPIFADLSKMIDRISEFNDCVTLALIKQKLFDEWGERSTLFHSTDKIIATMKELGVLKCDKPGKYTVEKYEVKNKTVVNFLIYVAMLVDKGSYYSYSDINNFPVMFPFTYEIGKEEIMSDKHFAVTNFGGEMTVALKGEMIWKIRSRTIWQFVSSAES